MEFLYPSFLFALSAISIPILVHLFNFRRYKTVAFSSLKFIKKARKETKSVSKIKNWLILLSRILAIVFLVLAFSKPYIASKISTIKENTPVLLFIDNSYSMQVQKNGIDLLQEAKSKAVSIINSYDKTTSFIVLNATASNKDSYPISFLNAKERVNELDFSNKSPTFKQLSQRIESITKDQKITRSHIYYISDFQKNTYRFNNIKFDTTQSSFFVHLPIGKNENIYIDSVWTKSPTHIENESELLYARIYNTTSSNVLNIPCQLHINGKLTNTTVIPSIGKENYTDITFKYANPNTSYIQGEISIEDPSVTFDNSYYFNYKIAKDIPVLDIYENTLSNAPKALFDSDSLFSFRSSTVGKMNYSSISKQNAVIIRSLDNFPSGLQTELIKVCENGGSVVLIPPKNPSSIKEYNNFLQSINSGYFSDKIDTNNQKVAKINYSHPFIQKVFKKENQAIDLPLVRKHFPIKTNNKIHQSILTFHGSKEFCVSFPFKNGAIILVGSPLDKEWSNFENHAIFVPIMYNSAIANNRQRNLSYTLGVNTQISVFGGVSNFPFQLAKKDSVVSTLQILESISNKNTLLIDNTINKIGQFIIQQKQETLDEIAINYNRQESNTKSYNLNELKNQIAQLNIPINIVDGTINDQLISAIEEQKNGKSYWKICLIFSLIFILLEILIIKVFHKKQS